MAYGFWPRSPLALAAHTLERHIYLFNFLLAVAPGRLWAWAFSFLVLCGPLSNMDLGHFGF
jgi:hypothetical protein